MIPDKINICGIMYDVKQCEDVFQSGGVHLGEITHSEALIKINSQAPESIKEQTLAHEWLHGALVQIGRADLSDDETFVCTLSAMMNITFCVRAN